MPYGRSRLTAAAQIGDPFLGGLVRGIGGVLGGGLRIASRLLPGPIGGIAGIAGGILAGGRPSRIQQVLPAPQVLIPTAGIRRAGSPRLPGGGRQASRIPGEPGRRRRMNPLNVKAVRRSTRRLAAFQREAKKVEKQLRKIAPSPRRSSRRDLAPGHGHVR